MTNSGSAGAATPEQYAEAMAILHQRPRTASRIDHDPRPGEPPAERRDEGEEGDGASTRRP